MMQNMEALEAIEGDNLNELTAKRNGSSGDKHGNSRRNGRITGSDDVGDANGSELNGIGIL